MDFEAIIGMIDEMATNTLGIKAIYLHTLPSAKDFIVKLYEARRKLFFIH